MPRRTTPSKPRRRRSNLLEFFETPPGFTRFLDSHVILEGTVFMPCVGDGLILKVLRQHEGIEPRTYITNDIDPARTAHCHFDAQIESEWAARFSLPRAKFDLTKAPPHLPEIDWVVDNPPFSKAYAMLLAARRFARVGVAFHLRISFEEPTLDREDFITAHPPDGRLILPRYRFDRTKKGTDSVCTAWLIWLRDPAEMYRIAYPFSEELHAKRTLVARRSVIDEPLELPDGRAATAAEGEDTGVPAKAGTGTDPSDASPAAEE